MSAEAGSDGGTSRAVRLFGDRKLHSGCKSMKRRLIAAVWITGATVPLLMATVFLVGCCVLPFHGVMHKLMPLCEMAASVIRADHGGHDDHEHDAVPPSPARDKQEPVKRIATELPYAFRLAVASAETRVTASASITSYRSRIALGAVRCDRDVGLHVLVETFLI
jgi:hypothetical protein